MWIRYIQAKVLGCLTRELPKKLAKTLTSSGAKFGTINFTTVSRNMANLSEEEREKEKKKRKFPSVYLRKMQGSEIGNTTENGEVEGIISSYQIEVITNTSQSDTDTIADAVADIMVSIGYEMIGEPFPDNTEDTYRNVSRWSRHIGSDDKLNF